MNQGQIEFYQRARSLEQRAEGAGDDKERRAITEEIYELLETRLWQSGYDQGMKSLRRALLSLVK